MNKTLEMFEEEIIKILGTYNPNNIDIVFDENDNEFCLMYHSSHNSFLVSNCKIKCLELSEKQLKEIAKNLEILADRHDIGTCF